MFLMCLSELDVCFAGHDAAGIEASICRNIILSNPHAVLLDHFDLFDLHNLFGRRSKPF